jgi:hypothetical protein
MKRLNERTVHLDDDEMEAFDQFSDRLDQGDSIPLAILQVRANRLRAKAPQVSDEFWQWLGQ